MVKRPHPRPLSITAVVTNHDYGRYLDRCLKTALRYCEEVLVYDDGSTDDSLDVIRRYPVTCVHRDDATGDPVWGSNLGMQEATCDHLIFLDADNYLISAPPITDADYTFAPVYVVANDERWLTTWEYPDWPLSAEGCWQKFVANAERNNPTIPYPWGGVWRTGFLRDKKWRPWDTTAFAADFRSALDWCKHDPALAYSPEPFLAFRTHKGQWSQSPERELMIAEACEVATSESFR